MNSLSNNADALRDRFIEEQEYIQRYIELLQRKIAPDTAEIYSVINTVEEYGFADRDSLYKGMSLYDKSYGSVEVQDLLSNLQQLKPDIEAALINAKQKISKIERPKDLLKVDGRSLAGECIEYLIEALGQEPSTDEIEAARAELRTQLKRSEEEPVLKLSSSISALDATAGFRG